MEQTPELPNKTPSSSISTNEPTSPSTSGTEVLGDDNVVIKKTKETYEWWNNLATLNEEDPAAVMVGKVLIRILGVIVLIALSPLIILGLITALMVAL